MNQAEEIKSKLSIVDVVREYVPDLKKVGSNWSARSPFRSEKTPSFVVNEDRGIFKDFGGDKAGDVITFVMEIENVNFQEALKICAQKAGIELKSFNSERSTELEKLKKVIVQINTIASETYNYILLEHENGKSALKYCENRGLDKDLIKEYSIGYAPKFLNLQKFILKRLQLPEINWSQISNLEIDSKTSLHPILQVCGLFTNREGRWVDKFNDRLMFAIKSQTGEIVGFSGRVIGKLDQRPKYINSPETVVYKKSDILFNFYQAKSSIKKLDKVIITEGQIDTISSTKAGFPNIVAPLGTSLTIDQVKLLKRYTDHFLLCFDNDPAGQKAMDKSYEMIVSLGGSCKVISLPENYKDIDEMVRNSPKDFEKSVADARDFIEYKVDKNFAGLRSLDNSIRLDTIKYLFHLIQLSKSEILRESYLQILSNATGLTRESLQKDFVVEVAGHPLPMSADRQAPHSQSGIRGSSGSNIDSNGLDSTPSYPAFIRDGERDEGAGGVLQFEKLYNPKELYLLALIYNFDEFKSKVIQLPVDFLASVENVYIQDIDKIKSDDNLSMHLSQVVIPEELIDATKEFDFVMKQLFLEYKKRGIRQIKRKIMSTEENDDDELLTEEFDNVSNFLKMTDKSNNI